MPVLIENIIATVVWLIIIGLLLTGGFVLVTVQRRITRQRYYQRLDRARQRAQELIEPLYLEPSDLEAALVAMQSFKSKLERRALEETLLWHRRIPEHLAITREVVGRLAWIREWIETVRCRVPWPSAELAAILQELDDQYKPPGWAPEWRQRLRANFVQRAISAEKLARVPTPEGVLALIAGTEDPHRDVQEVCIRNLGRLADSATLPVLIHHLLRVLQGDSQQSVRILKTALVQFHLEEIDGFRPALEHPERRVRFFATDVVREIADRQARTELLSKNDFSPEMYRLFTEKLANDTWGDVRARAALVIGHFHDTAANDILQRLLSDPEWFVRLHACRAAAGKFFLAIAPAIAERVSDSNWLVREAAVESLHEMGAFGIDQLYQIFVSTEDRYVAEQICEEIQRSGLLAELFANIDDGADRRVARLVARRMAALGKVTMLLAYLTSPVSPELKLMLIGELGACTLPDSLETLQLVAEQDPDSRVRGAAANAFQAALAQASAAVN